MGENRIKSIQDYIQRHDLLNSAPFKSEDKTDDGLPSVIARLSSYKISGETNIENLLPRRKRRAAMQCNAAQPSPGVMPRKRPLDVSEIATQPASSRRKHGGGQTNMRQTRKSLQSSENQAVLRSTEITCRPLSLTSQAQPIHSTETPLNRRILVGRLDAPIDDSRLQSHDETGSPWRLEHTSDSTRSSRHITRRARHDTQQTSLFGEHTGCLS